MGLYLSHPASLDHDTGDHPERARRLQVLESALAARDWLGWERAESPAAPDGQLALVHPPEHIELIEAAAARAAETGRPVMLDADTVVSPGSAQAARRAAGGAVELVRRLLDRDDVHRVGLAAHRPPGHHAPPDRAMGFCLFNQIAVAARYAIAELGLERVAIVDWDVHHGNGTQDVFYAAGDVLFCSIHQMPLYPGSGAASETGVGAGEGLTLNLPVRPGAGDAEFLERLDGPIADAVRGFAPQLLLVSAGFDAHAEDPLAHCRVSDAGFAVMAAVVGDLAAELEVPLGLVLEGGYDVDALARCVVAVMERLS